MNDSSAQRHGDPIRVVRIIARLNIGGPAIQAITLTARLASLGYRTTLVRGREDVHEGSMDHVADELGVRPLRIPSLRRDPGPHDIRALLELMRILGRDQPQIVHTHAAKAGTLGRLAALLLPARDRPVLVHTFHGHSLSGYFSSRRERLFLWIERALAKRTDRLIAVSEEVRDELVGFGVAPKERFEVIHLGFELRRFCADDTERALRRGRLRAELGVRRHAQLVTLVARLVPIKRVDRFLRVAESLSSRTDAHFLIVGDGELHEQLQGSAEATMLGDRLTWAGFRLDMPDVYFASDVTVLTSDNEGTPVSLIEALAAGVPVVSTKVGGVPSVVRDGETGLSAHVGDENGLAEAVFRLLNDFDGAARLAAAGREHVFQSFSLDQLVERIDELYRELLAAG